MELDVLRGARALLTRHRPIMLIEFIRSDQAGLEKFVVELGDRVFRIGINALAIHETDPTLRQIKQADGRLMLTA